MDRPSAKSNRRVIGLAIWLFAGGFLVWWVEKSVEGSLHNQLIPQLWHYATRQSASVDFQLDEPAYLAVGDPIFMVRDDAIRQVGQVTKVFVPNSRPITRASMARTGTATFHPLAPEIGPGAQLKYYSSDDSLQWVFQTILPPDKRAQIAGELSAAFEQNRAEILSAIRTVVEASLPEAMLVVEEDLRSALAAQREQWVQLGGKYQHELVERQLAPLVKKEIWPIVLGHVEPVANEVGREIWERASLWRLGWRSAYDKLQLGQEPLMRKEWARFLKEDALPVLQRRSDQFVHLQQKIVLDIARNQQVRAALREGVQYMADDPDLQALLSQILGEVIIQNPRLHQVLATHWTGPEAQHAFQIASERLEPTVVRIAELLFGSPRQGITPEFSRVLRSKVLGKDRRWLILETESASQQRRTDRAQTSSKPLVLTVRQGGAATVNPFDVDRSRTAHAARP